MQGPAQREVEDMFSHEYSHTMAKVLLLTNSQGASAEVLPALGLLQHACKVMPLEASVLVDTPFMDVVFVDARRDFPTAKSLTRLLATTGVGAPIIAITTEGGLTAFTADWGFNDVILDSAGPAEVDARIRIAVGAHAAHLESQDPTSSEIRQGDVVIDENTYTAKIKGTSLDLTLLQEIWGYDYFGGTRTVDVHIRRLRSKLGPEFESIIGTVRNVGYRFTVQNGGKETNSYELV